MSTLGPPPAWRVSRSPLAEFLSRELAPTPGRLGATIRLTLACTAATVPIMIHHIPHGLVVMIVMYLITKEDTTATLLGSVLGLLGITAGFVVALLAWQFALQTAWRLAFVFLFAAAGLYMNRILVIPGIGSAFGVMASMTMVLPDMLPVPDPEAMTEFVLWLWWCAALGLAVNLGVQLLLSPGDPLVLLRRALVERLRAVEDAVRSLGGRVHTGSRPSRPSLTELTVAGASEMLKLLQMATLRHAWARRHRAELGALISLVDQLVTAGAALEAAGPPALAGDTREQLEWVAVACARMARALTSPSTPQADELSRVDPPLASRAATVPALTVMEHALREIAIAMPGRASTDARSLVAAPVPKASLLLPDAFSNPEYVRFAVRGGLACFICDLLFVGFNCPGIYTSVITAFVVSLSTVGASTQKGILRFSGAAVGGGMGIVALMYVLPQVETLGGFWAVFAAGTAVAAWVNFGSPRVSYGGYQIGLAFYKVTLQGWGPVTELKVARDRLVGVAFGLVVFGLLEHYLWPVRASDRRQQHFADVLRLLADLARLGGRERSDGGPDPELDDLRRRISQALAETQRLLEESKFELQVGELDAFQRRLGDAQVIFLELLSIAYEGRLAAEWPADLSAATHQLEEAVAETLQELADSTRVGPARAPADLEAALAAIDRALTFAPHAAPAEETAIVLGRRLELYRTLVRLVSQLDPGQVIPSGGQTASTH
jgi:multidrug resistance protein MdtO